MATTNNNKKSVISSHVMKEFKKKQAQKTVRKVTKPRSMIEKEEQLRNTDVSSQQPETINPPEKKSTVTSSFQKRERFEEKHQRMTTYIRKDHHAKLNELKTTYRIPISEVINEALSDYFKNHPL